MPVAINMALTLLCVVLAGTVRGEVYTTVDRSSVEVNESFSMTLVADGSEVGEPDVSGLDANFDILGRSQSSDVTIINGRRQASRRWTYVLLPKAVGEFVIPPLSVGGVSSEPVPILVRAVAAKPKGQAEVFLEATLDREQSWVQAQVVLTLKLYLGVAVRQSSFEEPVVEGGDVIIERLAADRRYETQIDNRIYSVHERSYALYPQSSGSFTVNPVRFQASLWERGRISTPKVFRSEAQSLEVAPVVPPPAATPDAAWLPASDVRLRVEVRPDDGELDAGEPANIRLRLEAEGLLASQLPELELPEQPGLRIYPDQPDLETRARPDTMRAAREQSFAVIASRGGEFSLPELSVPWFDTTSGEWREARAALPTLQAEGIVAPTPLPPAATLAPGRLAADGDATDDIPDAPTMDPALERLLRAEIFRHKMTSYGLLALWLATVIWVWRSSHQARRKRRRQRRKRDFEAPFRAQHKAVKALQRACDKGDPYEVSDALVKWADLYFPDQGVSSLGDVLRILPPAQRPAVESLSRHLYGRDKSNWRADGIKALLQVMNRPGAAEQLAKGGELPPLFPAA